MPGILNSDGCGAGDTVRHFPSELGWCHLVLFSKQTQGGLTDAGRSVFAPHIIVAGNKIGMQCRRIIHLHDTPSKAQKGMARLRVVEFVGSWPVAPACHHPCCLGRLGKRSFHQHVIDRNRQRAGNQRQCIDPVRITCHYCR